MHVCPREEANGSYTLIPTEHPYPRTPASCFRAYPITPSSTPHRCLEAGFRVVPSSCGDTHVLPLGQESGLCKDEVHGPRHSTHRLSLSARLGMSPAARYLSKVVVEELSRVEHTYHILNDTIL